jgi:RHS repeat-associated protein
VLSDCTNTYTYGLNRIAQMGDSSTGYFLTDVLGSVRQVSDPTAAITLAQSYSPYGEVTTSLGSFATNYGYAGEWVDGSGLINLRARYYNPMNGQFITRDPFAGIYNLPSTMNGYSYANNNPVLLTDPSGDFAWLPILVAGGALVGAGVSYISQVNENYHSNGCNLSAALTTNINFASILESALAGSAIGLSIGVLGPVALGMVGEGLTGVGLLTGSTSIFTAGIFIGEVSTSVNAAIYGIDKAEKEITYHRPYIRNTVRQEVENQAPRTEDGRFIDPNTFEPIDGQYDLGHVPGHEYWREAAQAQAEGLTQQEFNNRMNNPDYYQIENPFSNQSHRFEMK